MVSMTFVIIRFPVFLTNIYRYIILHLCSIQSASIMIIHVFTDFNEFALHLTVNFSRVHWYECPTMLLIVQPNKMAALLVWNWRHILHIDTTLTEVLTNFALVLTIHATLASIPTGLEWMCVTLADTILTFCWASRDTRTFGFTFYILILAFSQTQHDFYSVRLLFT